MNGTAAPVRLDSMMNTCRSDTHEAQTDAQEATGYAGDSGGGRGGGGGQGTSRCHAKCPAGWQPDQGKGVLIAPGVGLTTNLQTFGSRSCTT